MKERTANEETTHILSMHNEHMWWDDGADYKELITNFL